MKKENFHHKVAEVEIAKSLSRRDKNSRMGDLLTRVTGTAKTRPPTIHI